MGMLDKMFGKKEEREFKGLIKALKYDDFDDRNKKARIAFEEIGEPAVESLIIALKDRNSNIRCGAAEVLKKNRKRKGG